MRPVKDCRRKKGNHLFGLPNLLQGLKVEEEYSTPQPLYTTVCYNSFGLNRVQCWTLNDYLRDSPI